MARLFVAALLALVTLLPPAWGGENPVFVANLRAGLEKMRADDWEGALAAAGPPGSVRRDIIEWHRLRASEGSFADTLAFLARRPDWPGLELLRKRSESTITDEDDPAKVRGFFAEVQPQTGHGALMLARALAKSGEVEQAQAQAVLAWFSLSMNADEETALLDGFGRALAAYHWSRADMLMWQGETTAAARLVPLLDAGHQALARARIALRRDADGVDAMIGAVPPALADDPGLAYERFLWRARKGRNQDAIDLLLERSASAESLGEPERWGNWRAVLARWSMREGKARQAYALAANHHISAGEDRNELEWLAGYVALRKLNDPGAALKHFLNFRDGVDSPISEGRAGYWLGRAYEALGDAENAQASYAWGGRNQTAFYGQLAAEKAGLPMDPKLTGSETFSGWEQSRFWGNSNMVAARLLQAADERYLALRFAQHLAESLNREEIGQMTAWAEAVDAPYLQVKLAKYVLGWGVLLERPYFALTDLGARHDGVPPELALAIARRESEFNPEVVSGVGARGLMQLMPGTARDMARTLELDYSTDRLTTDPGYNARLGQEYLAYLFGEMGHNPVLVAAAYNAGPGRAKAWRASIGDPGAPGVDVIDWIEHIPFDETRNYVMRVTEGLAIYRARLSGKTAPFRLAEDLKAR